MLDLININILRKCVKIDEKCIKDAFDKCKQEVEVGRWRADLKCGDLYIEIEPVDTVQCGLGQAMLWALSEGVPVALVLFGKKTDLPLEKIAKALPVLYIDVDSKNVYHYP
ncbi:MAG: hypothetical protein ACK4SY_10145 [Pyrobaculum sp.]